MIIKYFSCGGDLVEEEVKSVKFDVYPNGVLAYCRRTDKTSFEISSKKIIKIVDNYSLMKSLKDIKKIIKATGLTECENTDCQHCEFDKKSPEYKEFGGFNICMMLNEIYRTKE